MYSIITSRPYSNSTPHLGTCMDAVYSDVFARFFRRLKGHENVLWTMGMDDHSFKIVDKAQELGIAPKVFVDQKYAEFQKLYDRLEISYDLFDQTARPKHHFVANLVWDRLFSKGLLYKKSYDGLYCTGCEDFYAPSQLIDGHCPIHTNLTIKKVAEENYFFRLSSFKTQLLDYLDQVYVPDKSILVEMRNFVADLQDISFSREKARLNVKWGVTVWQDETQVMYVWFEALLSYLNGMVSDEIFEKWQKSNADQSDHLAANKLEGTEEKQQIEASVWKQIESKIPFDLMIMGRDNAKFHLVILPAILFGLGLGAPKAELIHGMINDSLGRKFAKSLGNGVDAVDFIDKYGVDALRFFVTFNCNSVGDTNFDWERLIETYNANLADNIGNSLNRVTTLIEKHFGGILPEQGEKSTSLIAEKSESGASENPAENLDNLELDLSKVYASLQLFRPELAFRALLEESTKINQFLEKTKPWTLAKFIETDEVKKLELESILYKSAKALGQISEGLSIFIPNAGQKMHTILKADKITKPQTPLFPKIELLD